MRNVSDLAELRCFAQAGAEADTASQPQVRVHGAAVCAVFPLLPLSAAVIEHVDRERTRETRPSIDRAMDHTVGIVIFWISSLFFLVSISAPFLQTGTCSSYW